MKLANLYKYLYFLVIILTISFLLITLFDYFNYDKAINSAPFSTFLIVRAIELLLPSIILFLVATFLKKKVKKS